MYAKLTSVNDLCVTCLRSINTDIYYQAMISSFILNLCFHRRVLHYFENVNIGILTLDIVVLFFLKIQHRCIVQQMKWHLVLEINFCVHIWSVQNICPSRKHLLLKGCHTCCCTSPISKGKRTPTVMIYMYLQWNSGISFAKKNTTVYIYVPWKTVLWHFDQHKMSQSK